MASIDYRLLRSTTARRLVQALERDGFTVSFHHSSDTFPLKTLRSMIETQAKWTQEDFSRLGLI
jgi:predicted RNA binding protein YcfA (HicA-like mRNA interferase family)